MQISSKFENQHAMQTTQCVESHTAPPQSRSKRAGGSTSGSKETVGLACIRRARITRLGLSMATPNLISLTWNGKEKKRAALLSAHSKETNLNLKRKGSVQEPICHLATGYNAKENFLKLTSNSHIRTEKKTKKNIKLGRENQNKREKRHRKLGDDGGGALSKEGRNGTS